MAKNRKSNIALMFLESRQMVSRHKSVGEILWYTRLTVIHWVILSKIYLLPGFLNPFNNDRTSNELPLLEKLSPLKKVHVELYSTNFGTENVLWHLHYVINCLVLIFMSKCFL